MEIIAFITSLIHLYPFTWEQTLIIGGLLKAVYDAIAKKQWNKIESIIMDQALPLVAEATLSNKDKRNAVVAAVYMRLPKWMLMIVTKDQLEKIVDYVYVTQIKPMIRREGIENKDSDDLKV